VLCFLCFNVSLVVGEFSSAWSIMVLMDHEDVVGNGGDRVLLQRVEEYRLRNVLSILGLIFFDVFHRATAHIVICFVCVV
jgi:hypothetical protein